MCVGKQCPQVWPPSLTFQVFLLSVRGQEARGEDSPGDPGSKGCNLARAWQGAELLWSPEPLSAGPSGPDSLPQCLPRPFFLPVQWGGWVPSRTHSAAACLCCAFPQHEVQACTWTPTGVPVDVWAPSPSQVAAHSALAEPSECFFLPTVGSPPPPGGPASSGSFIFSYSCLLTPVPQVAGDLLLCYHGLCLCGSGSTSSLPFVSLPCLSVQPDLQAQEAPLLRPISLLFLSPLPGTPPKGQGHPRRHH